MVIIVKCLEKHQEQTDMFKMLLILYYVENIGNIPSVNNKRCLAIVPLTELNYQMISFFVFHVCVFAFERSQSN